MHSSDLKDRVLWFDGKSSIKPEHVIDAVYRQYVDGQEFYVSELSDEIKAYNRMVLPQERIDIRTGIGEPPAPEWPAEIDDVDVDSAVAERLAEFIPNKPNAEQYIQRVEQELAIYRSKGLYPILKACIFVINTLSANQVVWGVGRGSAVASFVLYLIGVHDVNSVRYNLDITEFLGD